ncbi:thioredoxin reductase (NADPH) [Tardiphaga robiniae]|uniref:FAD-dependent oxidoreductase n=1 Tax=Tardiphaga robiniae TaxID=943830 RepID=UPI0028626B62|nr:FAD-dependent oxidoreductase [Tardiphaga robiniae]MDR6660848.1 thioredoxin reductase (NADPH) [Tardiphaga robiniae]
MDTDNQTSTAMSAPNSSSRLEQTFPSLTASEIERISRFGEPRSFHDGEQLLETGKPHPGMFVILSGRVAISNRDVTGHRKERFQYAEHQFVAEVGTLSGRVTLVDCHAVGETEALLVPPGGLRALLVAEADLGERIMRALILRRVNLIQDGVGGPVMIGEANTADVIRLQGFLSRNGMPHYLLDPSDDGDAADIVRRYSPRPEDLPLIVLPDGLVLRNPSVRELAQAAGMLKDGVIEKIYDVAVVGGGPAGLATAVYGASEGLSVLVCDGKSFGGQAGASARIENYLGFPTGISGLALMARAYNQAQKFGAEVMIPVAVTKLNCARKDDTFSLSLDDGATIRARSVVVASGARYRRPDIENLDAFEGRGVWYWASPIEAKVCKEQEVILVGGGNSAGQAAVFLSGYARKVTMMVRGAGLAASMSRYLIDRIEATPNIELLFSTEISGLLGAPASGLQQVRYRNRTSGEETTADVRNLFLFVGADPATGWLNTCGVELDSAGFVITDATRSGARSRPLETSVPGVFAVGDVRSSSVKRVGGAIGEGAQVVAALHMFLSDSVASVA